MCEGFFSDGIIANFLMILTLRQFRISVYYLIKLRHTKYCANFWGSPCTFVHPLRMYSLHDRVFSYKQPTFRVQTCAAENRSQHMCFRRVDG